MHSHPPSLAPASLVSLPPALAIHLPRAAVSDLEHAAATLANAVEYLVSEQLAGQYAALSANREAITLLTNAGHDLLHVERRRPAHASLAAWLRGASLSRARRHHHPDAADTTLG